MEVPKQYWRAWPGIRDRFSPANRAVEACLACPRVPSRAQADVPVSYPRVRSVCETENVQRRILRYPHRHVRVGRSRRSSRRSLSTPSLRAGPQRGQGPAGGPPSPLVKGATAARARWRPRPKAAGQSGLEHFNRLLPANTSSRFAGLLQADARTRTGDPFITSFGPLSPPVTVSHLRSLIAANPLDWR